MHVKSRRKREPGRCGEWQVRGLGGGGGAGEVWGGGPPRRGSTMVVGFVGTPTSEVKEKSHASPSLAVAIPRSLWMAE